MMEWFASQLLRLHMAPKYKVRTSCFVTLPTDNLDLILAITSYILLQVVYLYTKDGLGLGWFRVQGLLLRANFLNIATPC